MGATADDNGCRSLCQRQRHQDSLQDKNRGACAAMSGYFGHVEQVGARPGRMTWRES